MVNGETGRNLPSAIFAYRLQKLLTNRFLLVKIMLKSHANRFLSYLDSSQ